MSIAKGRCLSSFASLDRPFVPRESFPFFFAASCRRTQPIFSRSLELNVRGPIHTCNRSFSRYAIVTRFHVTAMKNHKKKSKKKKIVRVRVPIVVLLPPSCRFLFLFSSTVRAKYERHDRSKPSTPCRRSFCAVAKHLQRSCSREIVLRNWVPLVRGVYVC